MGDVKQKDRYPQLLHLNKLSMEVVNTYIEEGTNTPVHIGPTGSYVMEILKVYALVEGGFDANAAFTQLQLSKRPQIGLVHFDDEDLIATLQVSFAGT
ncbi:unnamed protein product, partial [marine sediment metagenome]